MCIKHVTVCFFAGREEGAEAGEEKMGRSGSRPVGRVRGGLLIP